MVSLPNKMTSFQSLLGFAILLAIPKSCESLSYDASSREMDYRHKQNRRDLLDAFNDEGFVEIKVSGQAYPLKGNQIFVAESYGDSDMELKFLRNINVQLINTFDDYDGDENFNISFPKFLEPDDSVAGFQVLSLENSQLFNLSSKTFKPLTNMKIRFLNMRFSNIQIVAEDTLEPLQPTLKILDLANATISVEDIIALMQGLRNDSSERRPSLLTVLSLANLGLNGIPYDALKPVQYSLKGLSFFGNNFRSASVNTVLDYEEDEYIEDDSSEDFEENYLKTILESSEISGGSSWANFPEMPFLAELDLRNCNIDYIERGSFRNLANLRKLFISGNNILVLRNYGFEGLTNLKVLDISFNRYERKLCKSEGMDLRKNSFAELFSLRTMNLSYTFIRHGTVNFLSKLPPSLHTLDFRGACLTSLDEGIFQNLNRLHTLDFSHNFGLGTELITANFNGLASLEELYMTRTALHSLGALQELYLLKRLDVRNNNLNSFEGLLGKFAHLEHLDASNNYINSWITERAFATNSKLKSVYLHSNSLSLMSEYMLEDFKSLSYLTLANNNFVCNCHLNEFMEYLTDMDENNTEKLPILIDYESEGTTHVCTDVSLSQTVGFASADDFCGDDLEQIWLSTLQHVFYIGVLVILCCVSVGGLIYWKWWYIKYFAVLIKNATVYSMMNLENCEDRIYTYDIFVSYSDENRNWVIQELLPNIEGPEARFSICLHERDFQVGVSILENITLGMDQSRTILLIISGCFLKSQWCQFEMHLAQHRLLETCRDELVLVLLEEIPKRKRPKTLQYLMVTKTYIVWPKDSRDTNARNLFWKRLRRAITANKSKRTSVA